MSSGSSSGGGGGGGGGNGPCGACKFLRRKCIKGCIFAPYFDSEQGATHFAAVHKVFGASNVSKLLQRIPIHKRLDAVVTICYEALARIRDPVYGCVGHIFALQQQEPELEHIRVSSVEEHPHPLAFRVVNLQAELAFVQAHLSTLEVPSSHHQAAAMSLSHHQSLAAMVPNNIIHASSTNNIALSNTTTTNGALSSTEFMSSLQSSQHNLDDQVAAAAASCCSPDTNQQQQQQQRIDDGELQALAREFVSRYFPEIKFQTSSSSC